MRIGVFCGGTVGHNPQFTAATHDLAVELANRRIGIVFGGARIGLMGVLADSALAVGGDIIGVIPHWLRDREIVHERVPQMHVVGGLAERKQVMARFSDAFLALPGGVGTMDELFEMCTWNKLGLQHKPCGLLNVDGFYDELAAFLTRVRTAGFLPENTSDLVTVSPDIHHLVGALVATAPPTYSPGPIPPVTAGPGG
ncbi:TIGR00730 family Rossman fold protein [Streptomyces sp. NBC_01283]|uniref:LOG family protein n=1 Tax=Streptomyces sp. NBC_01283 TaxID=2903812 RepID=UPI00352EBC28|nr:TIGR00730 family Rossman fold protein [Streptomyces sp. NBC_01283]